jgi:hypothetical protein
MCTNSEKDKKKVILDEERNCCEDQLVSRKMVHLAQDRIRQLRG